MTYQLKEFKNTNSLRNGSINFGQWLKNAQKKSSGKIQSILYLYLHLFYLLHITLCLQYYKAYV